MTFVGYFKSGKLFFEPYNQIRLNDFAKKNEGKKFRLEMVKSRVSDEMRGYYFGAIIPFIKSIVGEWGKLSDDQIHEILKKNFNGFVAYNPLTKRNERYGQSVASNDKENTKMMEYVMRIADYVMENYAQNLPDPEEYKVFRDSAQLK